MNQQQLDRFMGFVSPEPNSGCWLWTGSLTKSGGYGQISIDRKPHRAHRVSYEHFYCTDASEKVICHKCDVSSCVNPDHLFSGTHADNVQDKVKKGRQSRGEDRPMAKLTVEDILHIRMSDMSSIKLSKLLNVSRSLITKIRRNEAWRHVK